MSSFHRPSHAGQKSINDFFCLESCTASGVSAYILVLFSLFHSCIKTFSEIPYFDPPSPPNELRGSCVDPSDSCSFVFCYTPYRVPGSVGLLLWWFRLHINIIHSLAFFGFYHICIYKSVEEAKTRYPSTIQIYTFQ